MKAEIFFRSGQEAKVETLRRALQRNIYHGLELESSLSYYAASGGGGQWEYMYVRAGRYAKLLVASIPPSKGVRLGAAAPSPYGFYIYSVYMGQQRALQEKRADHLFPAVAIRERMVMVPQGLEKDLTDSQDLSPLFLPLETGGVVDVDFDDPGALDQACTRVGGILRSEIVQEVRAYHSYHKLEDIDLSQTAKDLGVDRNFILDGLRVEAKEKSVYTQLALSLDHDTLPLKSWTKVALSIRNDSEEALADLEVRISGPAQIRPTRIQTSVGSHSVQQVMIAIRPDEEGDFPLEIMPLLPKDQLLSEWILVHHVWLHVGQASVKPTP
jgi:hypothetical protein